eukprot:SM000012S25315  [mRNA]  locus=s12:198228:198635:- [translate_table: standard]
MSGGYWRAAGMTYLSYANACAAHLRACLKEPYKTQVATREAVHYKLSKWSDGQAQKPVCIDDMLGH